MRLKVGLAGLSKRQVRPDPVFRSLVGLLCIPGLANQSLLRNAFFFVVQVRCRATAERVDSHRSSGVSWGIHSPSSPVISRSLSASARACRSIIEYPFLISAMAGPSRNILISGFDSKMIQAGYNLVRHGFGKLAVCRT